MVIRVEQILFIQMIEVHDENWTNSICLNYKSQFKNKVKSIVFIKQWKLI